MKALHTLGDEVAAPSGMLVAEGKAEEREEEEEGEVVAIDVSEALLLVSEEEEEEDDAIDDDDEEVLSMLLLLVEAVGVPIVAMAVVGVPFVVKMELMVLSGIGGPENRVKVGNRGLLGTARQVSSCEGW